MNQVMYSSKSDLWETPQEIYDVLDKEFGFTLDACALPENAKCNKYYTPNDNGLIQTWSGTVWCNPPYGRNVGQWVAKAAESSKHGATVVMLLPARTDTRWFHKFINGHAEIRFIEGRIKFGGAKYNAPFPSMIVIFAGQRYST